MAHPDCPLQWGSLPPCSGRSVAQPSAHYPLVDDLARKVCCPLPVLRGMRKVIHLGVVGARLRNRLPTARGQAAPLEWAALSRNSAC